MRRNTNRNELTMDVKHCTAKMIALNNAEAKLTEQAEKLNRLHQLAANAAELSRQAKSRPGISRSSVAAAHCTLKINGEQLESAGVAQAKAKTNSRSIPPDTRHRSQIQGTGRERHRHRRHANNAVETALDEETDLGRRNPLNARRRSMQERRDFYNSIVQGWQNVSSGNGGSGEDDDREEGSSTDSSRFAYAGREYSADAARQPVVHCAESFVPFESGGSDHYDDERLACVEISSTEGLNSSDDSQSAGGNSKDGQEAARVPKGSGDNKRKKEKSQSDVDRVTTAPGNPRQNGTEIGTARVNSDAEYDEVQPYRLATVDLVERGKGTDNAAVDEHRNDGGDGNAQRSVVEGSTTRAISGVSDKVGAGNVSEMKQKPATAESDAKLSGNNGVTISDSAHSNSSSNTGDDTEQEKGSNTDREGTGTKPKQGTLEARANYATSKNKSDSQGGGLGNGTQSPPSGGRPYTAQQSQVAAAATAADAIRPSHNQNEPKVELRPGQPSSGGLFAITPEGKATGSNGHIGDSVASGHALHSHGTGGGVPAKGGGNPSAKSRRRTHNAQTNQPHWRNSASLASTLYCPRPGIYTSTGNAGDQEKAAPAGKSTPQGSGSLPATIGGKKRFHDVGTGTGHWLDSSLSL